MKRSILLFVLALSSLVSCEKPEILDGWPVVNPYNRFIVTNSLDVPVEITSYKLQNQQSISLAPDSSYGYWTMIVLPALTFEEDKIYFFHCDSLMLSSPYHNQVIISVLDLHALSDIREIENGFEKEFVITENIETD